MPTTMRAPAAAALKKQPLKSRRKLRPTWEVAERLYPRQGEWTEEAYLDLPDDELRAEFADGYLEFLPMPKIPHQRVSRHIFLSLHSFVDGGGLGEVFFDGTKTKLRDGQIRLPDIMVILNARLNRHTEDYFYGADLLVEIVSGTSKDRKRDLVEKRILYGETAVTEYWIVDPDFGKIVVLSLDGDKYKKVGEYKRGQRAASVLLKGFEIDVSEALAGMKR